MNRSEHRASLRLRLTLWVVMIFTIIQLTLGLVFLLYQREAIESYFRSRLLSHGTQVAGEISHYASDITDEWLASVVRRSPGIAPFEQMHVTLYDMEGNILASSDGSRVEFARLGVRDPSDIDQPLLKRLELEVLPRPAPEAREASAVLLRLHDRDDQPFLMLAATNDLYAQRMLEVLFRTFIVIMPIGVLAAAAAGWFIAGIAMAPIERARQIASRFAPESIGERVEVSSDDVEVARLERELEQARLRIEAGFASQERFMLNVSHELKTPVSVMVTEAETIRNETMSPATREFIHSAIVELHRLGRTIDSFLLLTRVREGKDLGHAQRYQINELVMDAVEHCASMAEQYEVVLRPALLASEEDVDAAVAGDPDLLRTMLDNLVRNAIRFSPSGASVRIAAARVDGHAVLRVRDRGAGIPEEMINRIFDRFAQAPGEMRRGRGHGLGLEIAQGIAELHMGRISVRNRSAGGCEFTIRLPLAPSQGGSLRDGRRQ